MKPCQPDKTTTNRTLQKVTRGLCVKMDTIINLGVPHIAEAIFKKTDIPTLIHCLYVSKTWRQLANGIFWHRCAFTSNKSGANLYTESDENGRTPLLWASVLGYTELEIELLKRYKDLLSKLVSKLNVTCEQGKTTLMYNCQRGNETVVKLLMECNANYFIKFVDIDMKSSCGKTALMYAWEGGHFNLVKMLWNYSDDSKNLPLNDRDKDGMTLLHIAYRSGDPELFKLILDRTGNQFYTMASYSQDEMTVFAWACKEGQVEMVKMMLDKAFPQYSESFRFFPQPGKDGRKAEFTKGFILACQHIQVDVIRLLSHTIVSKSKQSALGFVCQNKPSMIPFIMKNTLRFSIDVNDLDSRGCTAFMRECKSGNVSTVQAMLNNVTDSLGFFDFNATDPDGNTAFMLACLYGHLEIVNVLIFYADMGLNIQLNDKDNLSRTGLMLAIKNEQFFIVKRLLGKTSIIVPTKDYLQDPDLGFSTSDIVWDMLRERWERPDGVEARRGGMEIQTNGAIASTTNALEDEEINDVETFEDLMDDLE